MFIPVIYLFLKNIKENSLLSRSLFFHKHYEPGSLKYASKPADRYTRRDLYYIT